jgi:hypothetical protein
MATGANLGDMAKYVQAAGVIGTQIGGRSEFSAVAGGMAGEMLAYAGPRLPLGVSRERLAESATVRSAGAANSGMAGNINYAEWMLSQQRNGTELVANFRKEVSKAGNEVLGSPDRLAALANGLSPGLNLNASMMASGRGLDEVTQWGAKNSFGAETAMRSQFAVPLDWARTFLRQEGMDNKSVDNILDAKDQGDMIRRMTKAGIGVSRAQTMMQGLGNLTEQFGGVSAMLTMNNASVAARQDAPAREARARLYESKQTLAANFAAPFLSNAEGDRPDQTTLESLGGHLKNILGLHTEKHVGNLEIGTALSKRIEARFNEKLAGSIWNKDQKELMAAHDSALRGAGNARASMMEEAGEQGRRDEAERTGKAAAAAEQMATGRSGKEIAPELQDKFRELKESDERDAAMRSKAVAKGVPVVRRDGKGKAYEAGKEEGGFDEWDADTQRNALARWSDRRTTMDKLKDFMGSKEASPVKRAMAKRLKTESDKLAADQAQRAEITKKTAQGRVEEYMDRALKYDEELKASTTPEQRRSLNNLKEVFNKELYEDAVEMMGVEKRGVDSSGKVVEELRPLYEAAAERRTEELYAKRHNDTGRGWDGMSYEEKGRFRKKYQLLSKAQKASYKAQYITSKEREGILTDLAGGIGKEEVGKAMARMGAEHDRRLSYRKELQLIVGADRRWEDATDEEKAGAMYKSEAGFMDRLTDKVKTDAESRAEALDKKAVDPGKAPERVSGETPEQFKRRTAEWSVKKAAYDKNVSDAESIRISAARMGSATQLEKLRAVANMDEKTRTKQLSAMVDEEVGKKSKDDALYKLREKGTATGATKEDKEAWRAAKEKEVAERTSQIKQFEDSPMVKGLNMLDSIKSALQRILDGAKLTIKKPE